MTITPDRRPGASAPFPVPRLGPAGEAGAPAGNGGTDPDARDVREQPSSGLPPAPAPDRTRLSGLYSYRRSSLRPPRSTVAAGDDGAPSDGASRGHTAADLPLPPQPLRLSSERLRLDVDGRYPQMTASGTIHRGPTARVHWIASLVPDGSDRWRGSIWYKDDPGRLPHVDVTVTVTPRPFSINQRATAVFSGGGVLDRVVEYSYTSPYFHAVELEFDATPDAAPVTRIATCAHPNRPETMACEDLSIQTVFRRAGFDVRTSAGGGSIVPLASAQTDADARWSEAEMHDAMQTYWARFSSAAQWALWAFWAAQHESGPDLGGVMFDDIGPNHRQGTAIFTDSFIAQPPAGDAAPGPWVERMTFWTAVHEMGHAFNLAHSWQKSHPPAWGSAWVPLSNDAESRSFMNYPYNVAGGESAFFSDFGYGFADPELLFMRHAPERFVRMGDAAWFDNHGLQAPPDVPSGPLVLAVRANRAAPVFDFLEPVVLELKLTNTGPRPLTVDEQVLASENVVAILKRRGQGARQWLPYAQHCRAPRTTVLAPGASLYESLPVYAGRNGWDIADPGVYEVQVALDLDDQPVVSEPLTVKVRPPASRTEEHLAQDLFSDEAGRALAVGGTLVMPSAIAALEAVVDQAPDSRAALHAEAALAAPLATPYKVLQVPLDVRGATSAGLAGTEIRIRAPRHDEAAERLEASLVMPGAAAADTFGHVGYRRRVERLGRFLDRAGDPAAAARCQRRLHDVLEGRHVLRRVLDEVAGRARDYERRAVDAGDDDGT